MKTDACPARACMYREKGGGCAYGILTAEDVSVVDVSEVRGEKLYKVKSAAASGKQSITMGVTISQYAEFIRASFPRQEDQTVNGEQDSHVSRVLVNTFNLNPYQHQYFWDSGRFEAWCTRHRISMTISEVRQALLGASTL